MIESEIHDVKLCGIWPSKLLWVVGDSTIIQILAEFGLLPFIPSLLTLTTGIYKNL
jgi:hypothetical protein